MKPSTTTLAFHLSQACIRGGVEVVTQIKSADFCGCYTSTFQVKDPDGMVYEVIVKAHDSVEGEK